MNTLLHYLGEYFGTSANWTGPGGIPTRLREHFGYTLLALGLAFGIAFPLGLWTGHTGRGGAVVTLIANSARALPTYGLLVLLVMVLSPDGLVGVVLRLHDWIRPSAADPQSPLPPGTGEHPAESADSGPPGRDLVPSQTIEGSLR